MLLETIRRNQEMTNRIKDLMTNKGENGTKLFEFTCYTSTLFVEHDGVVGCVKHRASTDLPENPSENSRDIKLEDITNFTLDQVKKNGLNGDYSKEFVLHV